MSGRRVPEALRRQVSDRTAQGAPVAEVVAEFGVSASSVRRWSVRSRAGKGLADRPRPGRPRIQDTAVSVVSAVLATAGARIDSSDYSTRAVARATGLSQSVVVRAMARLAPAAPAPPAQRLVFVAASHPVLVLGFSSRMVPAARARPGRAFRRRGTGVIAALQSAGLIRWEQQYRTEGSPRVPAHIRSLMDEQPAERCIAFDPRGVLVQEAAGEWECCADLADFLAAVQAALGAVDTVPGTLLDALAGRVTSGLEGLRWSADVESLGKRVKTSDSPRSAPVNAGSSSNSQGTSHGLVPDSHWLPRGNLSLTEQLAIALRQEIIDSGYRSGDRIRPAQLASRLGLPRSAIDAALRRMIDEELLDGSRGGVRIPAVTAEDVLDLYAARLVLGTVLLRNLAARPRRHLVPVRQALRRVEAVAALRQGTEVDDADLRFQQELARASGLEQTARTFESLTRRLRMYISVLLLDYRPATDRIVLDDRRIYRALEAGDGTSAVAAWRGKLDNAVRHMAGMAQYRGFDVEVWARLTAG